LGLPDLVECSFAKLLEVTQEGIYGRVHSAVLQVASNDEKVKIKKIGF
jgi:hypothetical protein